MNQRRRGTVLGLILMIALLAGCSRPPILIGFAGPLSGSDSDLGVQGRNGVTLAIEEINADGGIAGRPLKLVAGDDFNDPDMVAVLNDEFVRDGVVAVIGHMTSDPSVAAAALRERGRIPYISPTASSPSLSRRDDFFFRIQGPSDRPARVLGEYLVTQVPGVRVAILLDTRNSAYSDPYARSFVAGLGNGGIVVFQQSLDIAAINDWAPIVGDLVASDPDAVMIVASAVDTARFAQVVRNAGLDWVLAASGWAATATVSTYGGRAIEGLLVARSVFALTETEQGRAFRDRFLGRFGREPSFAGARAYDATFVLAAALTKTGGRSEGLRDAIRDTGRFQSLLGPMELDRYGDVETSAVVFRYEGGTFVPVYRWSPEEE